MDPTAAAVPSLPTPTGTRLTQAAAWLEHAHGSSSCMLQTFHLSDFFLKKNNIVSNCMLLSKNPEDLQHYSFVFVLIV
jgi:hypothetical protein